MKALSFTRYFPAGILVLIFAACGAEEAAPDAALVAEGKALYLSQACATCHTSDGSKLLAPTFKGLYGKREQLSDGSRITVDEAYILESIRDPEAKIVMGYQPMHPPNVLSLDAKQEQALVAYIKSLK